MSEEKVNETADPTESFDISAVLPEEPTLAELLTRRARPGWKPRISHLPNAVVDGKFIVPIGGKVLIEYSDEWRDTTCWIVKAVFDTPEKCEGTTCNVGYVRLWNPSKGYYGATDYITGPATGALILKVPDKSRKWIPGEEESLQEMVKRRRRRTHSEEPPKPEVKLDENGQPVKKKRGRPKGSKNKSTLAKETASSSEEKK